MESKEPNIRVTENISNRISRAPITFSGHTAGQMGATVALKEQAIIYIYINNSFMEMEMKIVTWAKDLNACTHTYINTSH